MAVSGAAGAGPKRLCFFPKVAMNSSTCYAGLVVMLGGCSQEGAISGVSEHPAPMRLGGQSLPLV